MKREQKLHQLLVAFNDNEGNTVCSPFSTAMVLFMIAYGAGGSTFQQLSSVLHLDANGYQLSGENIQDLVNSLESLTEVKFRLANKIYVSDELTLNRRYKSALKSAFHSDVESVDFGNSAQVAKNVNDWCAAKTDNKINNIVNPDGFDSNTKLMLINSLYFKGEWKNTFEETDILNFYPEGDKEYPIEMMFRDDTMNYGVLEDKSASFVELSYKHVDYEDATNMFIILPSADKKLSDVDLKKLTLNKLFTSRPRKVRLFLPKFKVESTLNLKKPLSQLGLDSLFKSNADLRGIVDNFHLHVDSVLQKSFLDVNENGSEAASVTIAGMDDRFGVPNYPKMLHFQVNRPFYVVIATEDVITFVARVNRP